MDREETLKIMAVLRGAYPGFYRGMTAADAKGIVALWQEMFSAEPYQLVAAAVKALIASDPKGYPPHIGAVKEQVRHISQPEEMTEAEAWAIVSKALKRSTYNSQEEFAGLPPMLQRLVGSSNQLRDWALMDSSTVQSVVASNFQRSYKVRSAQKQALDKLPPEVLAALPALRGLPEARPLPGEREAVHG